MTTVLKQIKKYYQAKQISAFNFRCPFYSECSSGCPGFTKAREPLVGREYEKNELPRILFVSLDSGGGSKFADDRTAEGVRKWEERQDVSRLPKSRHWYLTHELAWTILKRFKPGLTLEHIGPFFAHTNSAKCSQNNTGHAQAHSRLFKNCRGYMGGELKVLAPDILVTQGVKARRAVEYAIDQKEISVLASSKSKAGGNKILKIAQKKVLWLDTYHPRAFGRFWRQKEQCWDRWATVAVDQDFLTRFQSKKWKSKDG